MPQSYGLKCSLYLLPAFSVALIILFCLFCVLLAESTKIYFLTIYLPIYHSP